MDGVFIFDELSAESTTMLYDSLERIFNELQGGVFRDGRGNVVELEPRYMNSLVPALKKL